MPHDDYSAAYMDAVLFDRSAWGKVAVTGADALAFLHNLTTNEVNNLPAGAGCEAFLTTAKARVVAHFFINHWRSQGEPTLLLDTDPGQAETLRRTLDHYLISEQVELADRTKDIALLTVCGPKSLDMVQQVFGVEMNALAPLHHVAMEDKGAYLRRQGILHLAGVDVFCPREQSATVSDRLLQGGAVAGSAETFECLRIEAGFPLFGQDFDENRLVMELGRAAQAISYTKGCFLGQEPIVMARDRGQVNRILLGVTVPEGSPLATGTRLFSVGVEVGQTTSSVFSPRLGHVIALAYLRRGYQEPGTELTIDPDCDGRKAIVSALPFGIPRPDVARDVGSITSATAAQ